MIPTLFEKNTRTFTGNGIGRLTDAISCSVVEVRNGEYELTMEYPVSGIHYEDLELERIIFAEPSQKGKNQPFPIYKISRPINGIVTVNAAHISYWLNDIVVKPFTAASCASALAAIPTNALNDCPFTFRTDKQVAGNFNCEVPKAVRGMLGGEQGSILDVYGKGDYEFDNFEVILHTNRGTDNGVTIHYGKNLTDLVRDTDLSNVYTGIVPFWKGSESSVSLNQVVYSDHRADFSHDIIKPVDMSEYWQEEPTLAQLQSRAQSYVRANEGWEVNDNIRISFVPLWETEEFKDVSLLEEVHLCDTVTIIYTALNVVTRTKVIRTEYDVLRERYISIELGSTRNSLGKVLMDDLKEEVDKNKTIAFNIVQHQGELLRGGLGGYMVINTDADGTPRELLFMNTPDRNTATKVLRINMNGIGFSDGYNANPNTAWTIDGKFNASYIQTGTCSANRVRTGTLESTGGEVKFDLDDGTLTMGDKALRITAGNLKIDANGNVTVSGTVTAGAGSKIGPWNVSASAITYNNGTYGSTGLYFGTSGISLGNKFKVSSAGVLECSGATISGAITATSLSLGNGVTVPYSKVSGTPDLTVYIAKDGTIGSTPSATTTGFKVSSAGLLTASNAVIYGTIYSSAGTIGGWNIAPYVLSSGSGNTKVVLNSSPSSQYAMFVGADAGGDAPFRIYKDGRIYASSATIEGSISGSNIYGSTISVGNGADDNAKLYISGTTGDVWAGNLNVMTTDGYPIGGWYQDGDTEGNATQNGHWMRLWTGHGLKISGELGEWFKCATYAVFTTHAYFREEVINSNGEVQFYSDKRKKQNIEYLNEQDSYATIMSLKPAKFAYKATPDIMHHGFIAQDVQEIIKDDWNIVTDFQDELTHEHVLTLKYQELLADIVAALQLQDKRIKALERGTL